MKSAVGILGLAAVMGWLFALTGPTAMAAPAKSTQLEEVVRPGEHWYGEKINLEDLRGKVVLYEFWGLN